MPDLTDATSRSLQTVRRPSESDQPQAGYQDNGGRDKLNQIDGDRFNNAGNGKQLNNTGSGSQFNNTTINGNVHLGNSTGSSGLSEKHLCLQSLAFPEMNSRYMDIEAAAEGTCDWLLQHKTYIDWTSYDRGLLWIKGKPGSGKSTLLRYVANQATAISNTGKEVLILSFFFHGRGSELQKTPLGLFRSLLHQLLNQIPETLADLVATFQERCKDFGEPGQKWQWHPGELQLFFKSSLAKVLQTRPVRLFVDALDECGKKNAVNMVGDFETILQKSPCSNLEQFRICFTCRHYPIVNLGAVFEVCVEKENKKDISTFVNGKLSSFRVRTSSPIPDLITERAKGVFLWAWLVVEQVLTFEREGEKLKTIEDKIQLVPQELDDLYYELVQNMGLDSLKLIKWICFAMRPLALDELRWALLVDTDSPHQALRDCEGAGDYPSDYNGMERRIQTLSCGLAEVTLQKSVQFIHQSVRDYFVDKGIGCILQSIKTESPKCDIVGHAHYRMSRICIKYLAMEEIRQLASNERYTIMSQFPFLYYATTAWVPHSNRSESYQADLLECLKWPSEELVRLWVRIYHVLDPHAEECPPRGSGIVHLVSRHKLIEPLLMILQGRKQDGTDVDKKDDAGLTPLAWAARNGHLAAVKLLLDLNKVNIDARNNRRCWSFLLWIAWNLWNPVCRNKVNVDARDVNSKTPLCLAGKNGHEGVVKLLLENGADIESQDKSGQTPLSRAAENEHEGVIKLLLEKGADIESKDEEYGQTPLSRAAENEHEGVIKLLLEKGADIESKDRFDQTPLSQAAENGHEVIVKLLYEKGASIRSKDEGGITVS